jgi:hypothetical protein
MSCARTKPTAFLTLAEYDKVPDSSHAHLEEFELFLDIMAFKEQFDGLNLLL